MNICKAKVTQVRRDAFIVEFEKLGRVTKLVGKKVFGNADDALAAKAYFEKNGTLEGMMEHIESNR